MIRDLRYFVDEFLTMEQAAKLFYELADMDIPYHNSEVCQGRYTEMSDILNQKSVAHKMICAFADVRQNMFLKGENTITSLYGWRYHVAPLVPVVHENGDIRDLVFDPSLFDGPVSIKQWANSFRAPKNGIVVAQSDGVAVANVGKINNIKIKKIGRRKDLKRFYNEHAQGKSGKRTVLMSAEFNRYFQKARNISRKKHGRTWVASKTF